jgi:hypothetical protein
MHVAVTDAPILRFAVAVTAKAGVDAMPSARNPDKAIGNKDRTVLDRFIEDDPLKA